MLRVRLSHEGSGVGQALGRFRLSVTAGATPLRIRGDLAPSSGRSSTSPSPTAPRSRTRISDTFYRSVATSLKLTRDRIAALQKDLSALEIPTALVMRERVATSGHRPTCGARQLHGQTASVSMPASRRSAAAADDQMPNRLGLARWLVTGQSAHRARRGQSCLGAVLRTRPRRDQRRLRHAGRRRRRIPSCSTGWRRSSSSADGAMKALHRLIVMSATYRQSSTAHARAGGARPVQPAAGARSAVPDGSRDGARRGARGQRAARA